MDSWRLRKSYWLDDWYVLHGPQYQRCWADPEGTAEEWREILKALRAGKTKRFRRVACIYPNPGEARLYSPRNCVGDCDGAGERGGNVSEIIRAIVAGLESEGGE